MQKKDCVKAGNNFSQLKAIYKLLICLAFAIIVYFLLSFKLDGFTHILYAWDVFSVSMLIVSWVTFVKTTPDEMRSMARRQDESRTIIFFIVLLSTFVSLMAVVLLLISKDAANSNKAIHLIVAISGMTFSWLLVHTIFTSRYAHLYYDDSDDKPAVMHGGLDFPGDNKPDYIDFAYFSFVLGMTFQVSDVEITSRKIRRLALMHGILSFAFNTIIVALTINVIAGLKN